MHPWRWGSNHKLHSVDFLQQFHFEKVTDTTQCVEKKSIILFFFFFSSEPFLFLDSITFMHTIARQLAARVDVNYSYS